MRKLANSELQRLDVTTFKEAAKTPIIVVLDNVRSLNNVGSVFRTADADSVEWQYIAATLEVVKQLKNEGVRIVSVEQAEYATMLQDFTPVKDTKYAVIFGNEVKGVAQEVVSASDEVIEIPQYGTKHSLNVSVSAGIVLWELLMKLKKA